MTEQFDELAADLDIGSVPTREDIQRIKAESAAAVARMDDELGRMEAALGIPGYSSVLDRTDAPAPLPTDKSYLDSRIRSLLEDLIAARDLALDMGDPRSARLTDALAAMPGDGS